MITLTATQEATLCKWLHPYEEKPVYAGGLSVR
jgi:hypothetical protein